MMKTAKTNQTQEPFTITRKEVNKLLFESSSPEDWEIYKASSQKDKDFIYYNYIAILADHGQNVIAEDDLN